MSLDFDAMKNKLTQLQGQNNRNVYVWKPTEGQNQIRIVPWKGNKGNPFIEMMFHYLGNKTLLSPLTYGRPDPIAEFADTLKSTNDRDDWQQSKKFAPKMRTFVPIIVRGQEDEGVKFWSFGKTVYKELLAIISDPDYGDITDPQTGRDIRLEFTPQKKSDTGFAKTAVRVKPVTAPITTDATLLKSILTEQPDINELYTEPSYDELKKALEEYLTPDKSVTAAVKSPMATDDDEDFVAPKPVKTTVTAPGDVSQKFDELFKE